MPRCTRGVRSLSFSSDGKILASGPGPGSFYGEIVLWDASTLSHLVTLEEDAVGGTVAFSPDGTTLAYDFGKLRLWDVATQRNIATLGGSNSVAFSPDGTLLASATSDINLWDVAALRIIATLKGHGSSVSSLSFSPDGMTLASGSGDSRGDGTVLLWDMSPYITPQTPDSDFNGDGMVNISDFLLFANQFGLSQGDAGYDARYDLDGDGTIGIGDFLIFGDAFG